MRAIQFIFALTIAIALAHKDKEAPAAIDLGAAGYKGPAGFVPKHSKAPGFVPPKGGVAPGYSITGSNFQFSDLPFFPGTGPKYDEPPVGPIVSTGKFPEPPFFETCRPNFYRTATQEEWGATCPAPYFYDTVGFGTQLISAACFLQQEWGRCLGKIISIGCRERFTLTWTNPLAIRQFLPQIGAARVLTQSFVNPIAQSFGSLAGNTLALGLNLRASASECRLKWSRGCEPLGALRVCAVPVAGGFIPPKHGYTSGYTSGSSVYSAADAGFDVYTAGFDIYSGGFGSQVAGMDTTFGLAFNPCAPFNGLTIRQIYEQAQAVLGGCCVSIQVVGVDPCSPALIDRCVAFINRSFSGGRLLGSVANEFFTTGACPAPQQQKQGQLYY